ncbi:MAG TPA: MEDS domain-containing protein [Bacillaceae bacterium]
MKNKMKELFEDYKGVHVLYCYKGMESYMEDVVDYIEAGVLEEEYVVLIENDHVYHKIHQELSTRLTSEHIKFVHWVNNFDFYYSSGSCHPPSIFDYFNKTMQTYMENKISFRAWAHVEWATMEEPLHIIEDLETTVDAALYKLQFPLICAYQKERMPEYLKTLLMTSHPYILLEDDIIVSEHYKSPMKAK